MASREVFIGCHGTSSLCRTKEMGGRSSLTDLFSRLNVAIAPHLLGEEF